MKKMKFKIAILIVTFGILGCVSDTDDSKSDKEISNNSSSGSYSSETIESPNPVDLPSITDSTNTTSTSSTTGTSSSTILLDKSDSTSTTETSSTSNTTDNQNISAFQNIVKNGEQKLLKNLVNKTTLNSYHLLASPIKTRNIKRLIAFTDKSNDLNLAYYRTGSGDKLEEIFYLPYKNNIWSSPISVTFQDFRIHSLQDIKKIGDKFPMMILSGDDTNYNTLLNLPTNSKDRFSNEQLIQLENQNRRLYYSFLVQGKWSKPILINNTHFHISAKLLKGPQNTALLIFEKDIDKNINTISDREIYFTYYNGILWNKAQKLTQNSNLDYRVKAKLIEGNYYITWVVDSDNDLNSSDDRKLYYAVITSTGIIEKYPAQIFNYNFDDPRPILGAHNGNPILFWQGSYSENTSGFKVRPILHSIYSGSWSDPVDIGIKGGNITDGDVFQFNGQTVLIYMDGNTLLSSVNNGNGWYSSGIVQNYGLSKFVMQKAISRLESNQELNLAVLGSIPKNNEYDNSIHFGNFPFLSDLSVDYPLCQRSCRLG